MFKKKHIKKNTENKMHEDAELLNHQELSEEAVEESLRTIYQEPQGDMPDMTKLERIKNKRWVWITAGVSSGLLILTAAAWAGFAFFKTFQGFTGKGLDLVVEGPEQIALGQEVTYFINYKNPLQQPLATVDIRINFPTDFIISEIRPAANSEGSVWRLGALAAEERGTIKVRGTFTGALGTISAVQAIATYRPANYSSDFEAMATKQINYSETVIQGNLQVPEKAIPGDKVALIYHYKNTGSEKLDDLNIKMILPEGFTPDLNATETSMLEGRVYIKEIGSLESGKQSEYTVFGTFASGYGGDAEVLAEIGRSGQDNKFLPMHRAEAVVPVLAGDLSLAFIVNGSEQQQRSVSYGDELHAIIGYENMADQDLTDVSLKLKLETIDINSGEVLANNQLVDYGRLQTSVTSSRNGSEIIWNKDGMANLALLPSRGSGSLDISVPIVYAAPSKGAIALRATLSADIKKIGDAELNRSVNMAPMVFVLMSDASLKAEARYYSEEGAPLGFGPLPPKIGEKTSYRIIWKLNKTVHSLKNVEVTAKLPRSVSFENIATSTAGELTFNSEDRTLHWKLNRMPTDVGEAETQFNIAITPAAVDDGRFAVLMEDIAFQATDEDIKDNILLAIKQLTTDLQNDEGAAGKGVVIK